LNSGGSSHEKAARFLSDRYRPFDHCPGLPGGHSADGHPGAGNKAWLFADEIIIE
jgi:hypothetical protein